MAKRTKTIKEVLSDSPKEIAGGITVAKLSPLYFNLEKLIKQPEPMYRMDMGGGRLYYRFEDGEPVFYTSVTTMIKNTLPTSPHLIKWIADRGQEEGMAEALERATYGTFMHAECATLLTTGKYDLDKLGAKLELFLTGEKMPYKKEWEEPLKKDILAFAQFMIDYNVSPLAIEIILYHPTDGYAGAIDLVCEMDYEEKGFFGETYASGANKGQPKESKRKRRILAIIDLKSGRKGFYESHELQLQAYANMWQIHYEECVERVYNWSPKDWRGTPSYNLKDQTDSKNLVKLPHLVELAKIEESKRSKTVSLIGGVIDLTKGLDGHVNELTFVELIKKNK
jgi:hypothetical protein